MRYALTFLFATVGLGCLGLGAYIGAVGVNRPMPDDALVGRVLPGESLRSPAGEDFLYARVRIRSASPDASGMTHIDRVFGNPRVRVEAADGEQTIVVGSPDDWRVGAGHDDRVVVEDLADAPLLANQDMSGVRSAIAPPYELSVRALRAGDQVTADVRDGRARRLMVGDAEALAADSSRRDAGRLPIMGLLLVMGAASLGVAYRVRP